MTVEKSRAELVSFIMELALPAVSKDKLEDRIDWTSERSFGNSDDVFSDGQVSEEARIALQCREFLGLA